jgi:coenzyme F420-reducing hydrogenase beta subunit
MQIFAKCCYHDNLDVSRTLEELEIDLNTVESITIESWHAKLIVMLTHGQKIEVTIKEIEDDY